MAEEERQDKGLRGDEPVYESIGAGRRPNGPAAAGDEDGPPPGLAPLGSLALDCK